MALPVWAIYMRKVYDDKSILINRSDFKRPESLVDWNFDCSEEIQDQLQEIREGNTEIDFD